MLKTNRENPGGGMRFKGRTGDSGYSPTVSQYNPVNSPNQSTSQFAAEEADPDTASLMGSLYDSSPTAPTGLSQIKSPSTSSEGITAAPPVLSAPPAPAPVLSSPSGIAGIRGGSGGGVSGSMGTYGNGQTMNGIPQFSVGYTGGPKVSPGKSIL